MADVVLEGVTLPVLRFMGRMPSLPVAINKKINEDVMSDGSIRWGFFVSKRQWTLRWGYLTKTELDALETLHMLDQSLSFVNNWEDATPYCVVIVSYNFGPVRADMRVMERYWCDMVLREA